MWDQVKERGTLPLLRIGVLAIGLLGEFGSGIIVRVAALYFLIAHRIACRASLEYLTALQGYSANRKTRSPAPTTTSVYKHLVAFGFAIVEKVRGWGGELPRSQFDLIGREELRGVLKEGRGVVLMSGHLGNIEVIRALIEQIGDVRINALMFTANAARFNAILRQVNPKSHLRVIPLEQIDVSVAIDLQQRVERGEVVAILADRLSPNSKERAFPVSFLGKTAALPEGPFVLASLLECPVFTVWCVHGPNGRYSAKFGKFADKILLPRKTRAQALTEYGQRFANEMEEQCIAAPFQWFNFYPFWDSAARFESPQRNGSV